MTFKLPTSLSLTQRTSISFLNGLDENSLLVATDFWSWNGDTPATYTGTGTAHKWGGSTTGTSASIQYYFDTGSNWTAAEQSTFLGAMALWGSIANISFTQASSETRAKNIGVVFYRYGSATVPSGQSTGYYSSDAYSSGTLGTSTAGTIARAYISAQTQNSGFGDITSFSLLGGYGISTIMHEMGHVLGLGHAGPYNGTVNAATQQLDATDNRLYSIMSYITPWNTSAAYYNDYTVTGTNWGSSYSSTTPQQLDILAIQQLYGTSTGSTLTTAQTFGFNTTLAASDPIRMFFDFTINTNPVVTIYDSAAGNTLDLSGFSLGSTINLNPGTFSSVAGMTNNLAIAYNTDIDTVIGGAGNDVFIAGADADTFFGGGGSDKVIFPLARSSYTVVTNGGTADVTDTTTGITDHLVGIATTQFSDSTQVTCFRAGTRIAVPGGERAIETLAIGETVLTADGGEVAIRWLGRRAYDARLVAANAHVVPVIFRPGSLGPGLPRRTLAVSPTHAMWVEGRLAPAATLVNGRSILRGPRAAVTYYHIELDRHALVLAEGAAAESFVDDDSRWMFDNAEEYFDLYGVGPAPAMARMPRLAEGFALAALRRRLAARAGVALPPPKPAGALRGHVERIEGDVAEGWVTDAAGQSGLVLDFVRDGRVVLRAVANRYRADLDFAGLAGGACGFRVALPSGDGRWVVRRSADGAVLPADGTRGERRAGRPQRGLTEQPSGRTGEGNRRRETTDDREATWRRHRGACAGHGRDAPGVRALRQSHHGAV